MRPALQRARDLLQRIRSSLCPVSGRPLPLRLADPLAQVIGELSNIEHLQAKEATAALAAGEHALADLRRWRLAQIHALSGRQEPDPWQIR